MRTSFETDSYPGRPRILFVGSSESTHTHSWIDLLDESELNVRLFGLPSGVPPDHWKVRTYVTGITALRLDPNTRLRFYSRSQLGQLYKKGVSLLLLGNVRELEERWLARIVHRWRPHAIHTLGLNYASYFYLRARERFGLQGHGKWVVQVRGGPDLALHRLMPEHSDNIRSVLKECDQLIADNQQNYDYAIGMGLNDAKVSPLGVVPGTGGIDVAQLARFRTEATSERNVVIWPKAYECPQSKALPVLEAIKLAWDRIQPCEFHIVAITPETLMWYKTLPEKVQQACRVSQRIPRSEMLKLLARARVVLAPSLADGVPNVMYEAMATGAFPIVSPLETIRTVVGSERNVLFARNLYPEEMAAALERAMSDDALVDRAAHANLELVQKIADRAEIGPRVIAFYQSLAKETCVKAVGAVSAGVEKMA